MELREAIDTFKQGGPSMAAWCLIVEALDRHPRVLDVLLERERQIGEEGWSARHDDNHLAGELAVAGVAYASTIADPEGADVPFDCLTVVWPWSEAAWKPTQDPIRNAIKATALLVAEMERRDRANARDRAKAGEVARA